MYSTLDKRSFIKETDMKCNQANAATSLLKANLHDSNGMISDIFKLQLECMNRRLSFFNYEKKVLKELDLFVLDNSLQESTVGRLRGHTLENKWKIYSEVKKAGVEYIIVASLSRITRTGEPFLDFLRTKGIDGSKHFAFVECFETCTKTNTIKTDLPMGLEKCRKHGINNVIMELDLFSREMSYGKFNAHRVCALLTERISWIRQNISQSSLIFINIRDFSDCMKYHPARVLFLVNYLASFPEKERIFGIMYEDGGKYYSEQVAVWTFCVREELIRCGWHNCHLLVNIRDQYGLSNGTLLDCLADGATGMWAAICDEGGSMGHASYCLAIMNLIRLGNTNVAKKYKCENLREAARAVTVITTGHPPYLRQPIVGDRALSIYFGLEPRNHCSVEHVKMFNDCVESELVITNESSSAKILTKLTAAFGTETNFDFQRAKEMKEVMIKDMQMGKNEEYDSPAGLAILYEKSGGSLTPAMKNAIQKKTSRSSHLEGLIEEIRKIWDEWNVYDEERGDKLDYSAFHSAFVAPYFSGWKDNDTNRLLEAIKIKRGAKVIWRDFAVHLKWAANRYPETETADELLTVAFRQRIITAMQEQLIEQAQPRHYSEVISEKFYTNYEYDPDLFFRAHDVEVDEDLMMEKHQRITIGSAYGEMEMSEDFVTAEAVPEVESGQDEEAFFAMLEQDTDDVSQNVRNNTKYKIRVKTGDVHHGGTDSKVFIILCGDSERTDKICLEKGNNEAFDQNGEDLFEIEALNVGNIRSIIIGHDNTGANSKGWYLTFVEVYIPAQGRNLHFTANKWLDEQTQEDRPFEVQLLPEDINAQMEDLGEDCATAEIIAVVESGQNEKDIFAALDELGDDTTDILHQEKQIKYEITVKTGDVQMAGTDANVYIYLYGENGTTGKLDLGLPDEDGRFDQNKKDTFIVEAIEVGEIKSVRIGHDNKGGCAGWYLDWVTVKTNAYYKTFTAERWLDSDKDDKIIEVELYAVERTDPEIAEEQVEVSERTDIQLIEQLEDKVIQYDITVKTGDYYGAGTDANVYICLFGDKGINTGNIVLGPKDGDRKEIFEQDRKDLFKINAVDIGELKSIRIGHDNKGGFAGWYVDWVSVKAHAYYLMFKADRWLDTREGDKKLEVELYPRAREEEVQSVTFHVTDKDAVKEPTEINVRAAQMRMYDIHVKTGDVRYAGTDAGVYLTIYGEYGVTHKFYLENSTTHTSTFERNQVDVFCVEEVDVGNIERIRIGHDGSGPGAGWHLEDVVIEPAGSDRKWKFVASRWLDSRSGDGKIEIDLHPETSNVAKKRMYDIYVKTGDVRYAGTDAKVYIMMYGEYGVTHKIFLENSKTYKSPFERKQVDVFSTEEANVGNIEKIRIGHDGSGPGAGWHLADVVIEAAGYKRKWKFIGNRWLDSKSGDGKIEIELRAEPFNAANVRMYEIHVKTGDVRYAGTDAKVYLTIYGEDDFTHKIFLENSKTYKSPFERNQVDVFSVEEVNVGNIERIRIGHDGSGPGAGWYLDDVVIETGGDKRKWKFSANRWLDSKSSDGKIEVDLRAQTSK